MFKLKKSFLCVVVSLLLVLSIGGLAFAQPTDIKGHWAETQITQWVNNGLANGFPDGTFKPNAEITRAQFVTLVNNAFGFNEIGETSFTDVKSTDWFASEVAKASYISGYEDGSFKPNNKISRQEAAVIIAKIMKLAPSSSGADRFTDKASIPQWSKGAVGAVVAKGFMSGYPDQSFGPVKAISRAEAVSSLDRAMKSTMKTVTYDEAGTYGPEEGTETIKGNVTVSVEDVVLQNLVITGDLLLAEGIGDGDVTLINVTVKGNTIIKGGGANSVTLENCNLASITVSKEGVRVVASGTTTVNIVTLQSGATLVEVTVTGEGFQQVTISEVVPAGAKVTLDGDFKEVTVSAPVNVEVPKGTVQNLTVNAQANITGSGTINAATINTSGVTIAQQPTTVTVAPSVSASVGGETISNNTTTPTTTTGGGGGGGGGGGTATVSVSSVEVTRSDASVTDSTVPYSFNFTGVSGDKLIQSIRVNSSVAGAKVNITQVSVDGIDFIASGEEKLNLSTNSNITMQSLIGSGLGANGVSLGNLRQMLGDNKDIVVTGYVSATSYNNNNVTVTINIGSGAGSAAGEYMTIARAGTDITATVNPVKASTKISEIGVLDTLGIWGHTIVAIKTSGNAEVDGLTATGEAAIKQQMENWTGVGAGNYNNITLQHLVNATTGGGYIKVLNADNGNTYTIRAN